MRELDEDALLDLHGRVRRARTKYMKLYRRQASARIGNVGARGAARPQNRRNADKAEVFRDRVGPGQQAGRCGGAAHGCEIEI